MKAMMVFIRETSRRLVEEFGKNADADAEFELKDVFGKYSMDTIASCAFGVDAQSFASTGTLCHLALFGQLKLHYEMAAVLV